MTRLAVVIPSTGRDSVRACIDSLLPQIGDDYLYLALDRPDVPDDLYQWLHYDSTWRDNVAAMTCTEALGQFGHPQRNRILHALSEDVTHVWSLDDDDVALPGALDAIRSEVENAPLRWFAFQMRFGPGSHAPGIVCWRERVVRLGDIGTPCIVMPASAKSRWGSLGVDQFGRDYGPGYFGDFEMAKSLEAELGPPVWVPEVIAEIRPIAGDQ